MKLYPLLKTLIHKAYASRLTSIQMQNTAGGEGYVQQNMYNIQDINVAEDTNDNTTVTAPGVERATTLGSNTAGSTYVATNASTITAEVTTAINQLAANQTYILQQMAAMSVAAPLPPPAVAMPAFNIPPVTNVAIPTGGFQQGGSLARGGGGSRKRGGCGIHAGCGRNLFAKHMATVGHSGAGQYIPPFGRQTGFPGATIPPLMQLQQQHRDRATPSPVKRYNNWNMCYSCGFDVKDRHTLVACLFCKPTHQTGFTQANAQQYIAGGHTACQRGYIRHSS